VIKKVKANQYALPFDVIILDLDMPIMNGFEACLKLRQGEGSGGGQELQQIFRIETKAKLKNAGGGDTTILGDINERLLIIAVSALITDSIVEKIKKCGFDDYST
jgi:CheY-like chemotaxis protein